MKKPPRARYGVVALLALMATLAPEAGAQAPGETIAYVNADVVTMAPGNPKADAVASRDGRILAVGRRAAVIQAAGHRPRVVDLRGRTLVPGLIDTHGHLQQYGTSLAHYVQVYPWQVKGISGMLDALRKGTPFQGWLIGYGFDQSLYMPRPAAAFAPVPTRRQLDTVSATLPVVVVNASGHQAYVNSVVLSRAGVTGDVPLPGGGIDFAAGTVTELAAMNYIFGRAGLPNATDAAATRAGARAYARAGYTTATEGDLDSPTDLAIYMDVTRQPGWPVRVVAKVDGRSGGMDGVIATAQSYRTEKFSIRFGKLFADGSIQAGTALLHDGYFRFPATPTPVVTQDQLDAQAANLVAHGLGVAIHCNGDEAVDLALHAVRSAFAARPRPDLRALLIHAQVLHPAQIDAMAEARSAGVDLGVTFFTAHVNYWGDKHLALFLGKPRAPHMDPMASAFARGIPVGMHNDSPVTPPNPLLSMSTAVTRLTESGQVLGQDEGVTAFQALAANTRLAAHLLGLQDEIGILAPGMRADMTILGSNPLKIPPRQIANIPVLGTIVDGVQVSP